MTLDFHARQAIRHARSQHAREHARQLDLEETPGTCSKCHTPWNLPDPGCRTCQDRQRRRHYNTRQNAA